MTRRFTRLAWAAATVTYLLIVLGAIVRITGSGMGCGEHWPLCNGRLFPPLDDLGTLIEWNHRLAAALVSVFVVALAGYAWWLKRGVGRGAWGVSHRAAFVAIGLLVLQVAIGAITVKLSLPPWTVILHLGTAMLLLAALLMATRGRRLTPGASRGIQGAPSSPRSRAGLVAAALGFVTVLLGALTANLGAASACLGFPLCNGEILPDGNYLEHIHWTHRLLAYTLFGYTLWWAIRTRRRGAWYVVALVVLQGVVAATLVLLGLPRPLQAVHVAVGAGVWGALVLAAL